MSEQKGTSLSQVAIIAAMEREIRPLVKNWRAQEVECGGRRFRFFESEHAVAVCGGIGPEPARRACEAVIAHYQPTLVVSAGFAGALDAQLKVGDVLTPRRVVDAADSSSLDTGRGSGVLVSFSAIAGAAQKASLARAYGALAVDMEAAAVARGAGARGLAFFPVKAISDASNFDFSALQRFVTPQGGFRTVAFLAFVMVRPWLWGKLLTLARNHARAARALCRWLQQYTREAELEGAAGLRLTGVKRQL